jgi:DNA-binding transcriptional regulator YdaS (Cro superfamily)
MVAMEKLNEFFKSNRGMQARLAEHLNLQPSTISQWKNVPVEYLPEVSEFTGISREELVPDAFRPARESAA